ncbi:MAG: methyltransferase domain-containing protein [Candidatus Nitrospinota bacterium M3_3B_026]
MTSSRIKNAFDKSAPGYDDYARFQNETSRALAERIAALRLDNAVALDIGCGTGALSAALSASGAFRMALGCDISGGMLRAAMRKRNGNGALRLAQADAVRLPVREGAVDIVVSNLALHWVEDLSTALRQAAAVLRRGGRMALTVLGPSTFNEIRRAARAALAREGKRADDSMFHRFVGEGELQDAAGAAGLSMTTESGVHVRVFESPESLMRTLKRQGVQNSPGFSGLGLGRRRVMRAFAEEYANRFPAQGGVRVTYEVIYVSAERL